MTYKSVSDGGKPSIPVANLWFHWRPYMTAARAREPGLVDMGAEAGRSWPIIWETFGKLRPSSTERTQGSAVRLAMARREGHLERNH